MKKIVILIFTILFTLLSKIKSNAAQVIGMNTCTKEYCQSTANLNIRKGIGTQTPALITVPNGTELDFIRPAAEGWVNVRYHGITGFVSGKYVGLVSALYPSCSVTDDAAIIAKARQRPFGDAGRFIIPEVNVDVALFCVSLWQDPLEEAQAVCDRKDSAVYYYDTSVPIVADHKNQGFSQISECKRGTTAYIIHADGITEKFVVSELTDGINNPNGNVVTFDGRDIFAGEKCADLALYTCLENWQHVRIVFLTRS